ncbi:hypothetical protein J4204_04410 [Candidatus Woesearchaeota archaeon]|nr:hypothetical protein [Candidatus Woesearchaeota archaeon]
MTNKENKGRQPNGRAMILTEMLDCLFEKGFLFEEGFFGVYFAVRIE